MNGNSTFYYIPIPQKPEEQHRLDGLLNGLEPFYEMETRNFLQICSEHPTLDPILSKLASHVVRPPAPEPEQEPEPEPREKR